MAFTLTTPIKALLLAGAAWLGYKAYEKKLIPGVGPADSADPSPGSSPATPSGPKKVYTPKLVTPVPLSDFPLKRGSRGEYVKTLQRHLGVGVDGIFGTVTETALLRRYGKKQIMTLGELTVMIQKGTTVPVVPSTQPSKPKPSAGTPSKTLTAYQQKLQNQMWAVFSAIWQEDVISGKKIYSVRLLIDTTVINNTLGPMDDKNLKAFNAAYNRSFKSLTFAPSDRRVGTLADDLDRVSNLKRTVAFTKLQTRVRGLA